NSGVLSGPTVSLSVPTPGAGGRRLPRKDGAGRGCRGHEKNAGGPQPVSSAASSLLARCSVASIVQLPGGGGLYLERTLTGIRRIDSSADVSNRLLGSALRRAPLLDKPRRSLVDVMTRGGLLRVGWFD